MPIITVPDKQKIKSLNEGFFDTLMADDNALFQGNVTQGETAFEHIYKQTEEVEIKPKIEEWLKQYHVQDYEIECTGSGIIVNVDTHLILPNLKLTKFPLFKWGHIKGDCNFSNNRFTSFKEFPSHINGDLIANFNYIRNFDGLGIVNGKIYADRQKTKTYYKLNDANYKKYMNNENLMESVVYSVNDKEYGKLTSITENEQFCTILLNNGNNVTRKTCDVDVIDSYKYLSKI